MIEATYCPEDNKLRLYSGRVSRELYEQLRAAGYKSTPKQSCDFVATWTPSREDLALSLLEPGDDIGDEDQSPEDRAADRAERFSGYRDKRRAEAHGHADAYDAGPGVIGSAGTAGSDAAARRAVRSQERNQRHAASQWSKAEYWQTRTAGVISHALHKSDPATRRGRIIRIETEQRRYAKPGGRWWDHFDRRLAYERAMLENEGGSADAVEIEPGGTYGGALVLKVNKSRATGRVVSVQCLIKFQGQEIAHKYNIQRDAEGRYKEPTPETLAKLKAYRAEQRAKAKKANANKPKLINPTPEDAERLQEELNRAAYDRRQKANPHTTSKEYRPTPVLYLTQKQYTANSGGAYSRLETMPLHAGPSLDRGPIHRRNTAPVVCKLRIGPRKAFTRPTGTPGMSYVEHYGEAEAVICITDKPQKPLPDWTPAPVEQAEHATA